MKETIGMVVLLLGVASVIALGFYFGERQTGETSGVFERVEYIPGGWGSPQKTIIHLKGGKTVILKGHWSISVPKGHGGICFVRKGNDWELADR